MQEKSSGDPDDLAHALSTLDHWPGSSDSAQWIQTHISHVFLVGDRVYKMRKSVQFSFVDFGTTELRNADCMNEVLLNRRLAPDVYLGVAAIHAESEDQASVSIGPILESIEDPASEHFVVMRRLPEGRDTRSLLDADQLAPHHLESAAARIERFHASHGLGRPAPWSAKEWFQRLEDPITTSLESLVEAAETSAARERIDRLAQLIQDRLQSLAPAFERRRQEGRLVDGHGDLHLEHIWFEADPSRGSVDSPEADAAPAIIDCVEFDADLRRIDSASEVAFLAMDLTYRGRRDLAEWFLASYAMRSDDYGLFEVVDFFACYRALVRAKVAALAAQEDTIPRAQREKARHSVETHLDLAESLLAAPSGGQLVVFCGTVGSGKSSVVRYMAESGGGIPIASDRVRKHQAGLEATTRTGAAPDQGLYRPEQTDAVYAGLLDRAMPILESGRTALLDASFTTRAQRDSVREWASRQGIPVRLVEVQCDSEIARSRLAARERRGDDPSDAGPDFLAVSLERFEPPTEWPETSHVVVRTDAPDWRSKMG